MERCQEKSFFLENPCSTIFVNLSLTKRRTGLNEGSIERSPHGHSNQNIASLVGSGVLPKARKPAILDREFHGSYRQNEEADTSRLGLRLKNTIRCVTSSKQLADKIWNIARTIEGIPMFAIFELRHYVLPICRITVSGTLSRDSLVKAHVKVDRRASRKE